MHADAIGDYTPGALGAWTRTPNGVPTGVDAYTLSTAGKAQIARDNRMSSDCTVGVMTSKKHTEKTGMEYEAVDTDVLWVYARHTG